jgi:hypothetical protein
MEKVGDFDLEHDGLNRPQDFEDQIEDLSSRLEQLENLAQERDSSRRGGVGLIYALGMAIAVTLSWAKNASILWCILHGMFSWAYIIYFAATR